MAIDVEAEDLVPFQFAAEAFPKGVFRPCKATLHRWKNIGVRGRKLETVKIGGIRYTSREAIVRFCREPAAEPVVTKSQRSRRTSSALKALVGMGVE